MRWEQPFSSDPAVAVIGGGLAGLSCALELARLGMRSVVFDTGEHGSGGRLATRATEDGSIRGAWLRRGGDCGRQPDLQAANLVFDHAGGYSVDPLTLWVPVYSNSGFGGMGYKLGYEV